MEGGMKYQTRKNGRREGRIRPPPPVRLLLFTPVVVSPLLSLYFPSFLAHAAKARNCRQSEGKEKLARADAIRMRIPTAVSLLMKQVGERRRNESRKEGRKKERGSWFFDDQKSDE